MKEATKRPMMTLKELHASEAEIGETVHTITVAWVKSTLIQCCKKLKNENF